MSFDCPPWQSPETLKFSKMFATQIENMRMKNYHLKSAKINFIVYCRKEIAEQKIKIILPELYFERRID
ncbi:hypothetical protein [Chryseobacterium sp. Leaf394]|uniref:hypothetical protein n=1 Tax=Chryseobacterium sp. Leaf394 TaxID=1736361 RepID=UPI000AEA35AA|nr:hypothetical protein [Chryseobacterium sp. Leaf394]